MTSTFRMGLCAAVLSSGLAFAQQSYEPSQQSSSPQEGALAPCPEVQAPPSGGGAGASAQEPQLMPPTVGSTRGYEQQPGIQQEPGTGGAFSSGNEQAMEEEREMARHEKKNNKGADRGFYVQAGAGAEGYTGALAPAIDVGPSYGATLGLRPWRQLGVELGYSGAVNSIDLHGRSTDITLANPGAGVDIMRNGGQAAVIVDLSPTRFQPYIMGGYGIERYNVRNGGELGFRDDTNGYVPAGAGFRYQFGNTFHADLRGNYSFLVGDSFSPVRDTGASDGRLQAQLMAGGTF